MSHDRGKRPVVVTGASGYIGRHVVRALLRRGFPVRAVVRENARMDVDGPMELVRADVLASDVDVERVLGPDPSGLIHLAWQDGFDHNAPSHMQNVSAHFSFLSSAAEHVSRLAALGSMHEVGYWEGAITADTPTSPRSLYGIAKDALRRSLMISIAGRTEFCWLRCYYIYGDDRKNHSIFTKLLEAVDEGKPTFPFTTGANKYDFIRVDELAEQIAVASTTPGVTGVINCSSGVAVSLAEQVEGFIRDNDLPIRLDYGAFPDRPYDSPAVWGASEDIRGLMAADAAGDSPCSGS